LRRDGDELKTEGRGDKVMTNKKNPESPTRRQFFKTAGLGTVAAAGVAVVGAETAPAEAKSTSPDGQVYRETAHVKRYYELANKF
jgi:nitrous oxide reductase